MLAVNYSFDFLFSQTSKLVAEAVTNGIQSPALCLSPGEYKCMHLRYHWSLNNKDLLHLDGSDHEWKLDFTAQLTDFTVYLLNCWHCSKSLQQNEMLPDVSFPAVSEKSVSSQQRGRAEVEGESIEVREQHASPCAYFTAIVYYINWHE